LTPQRHHEDHTINKSTGITPRHHKSTKQSTQTLPELLAESEDVRAQMVANLLPLNMALIEVIVKLVVAYRESLAAQSGYYKLIGKKETYKFLKRNNNNNADTFAIWQRWRSTVTSI